MVEEKVDILFQEIVIPQPSPLIDMMPQRTTNGIILSSMRYGLNELRYNRPLRRFFNVFSVRPPSEIVRLFYRTVRTGKQRDIVCHPCRRAFVINLIDHGLIVLAIKFIDIGMELGIQVFLGG